MTNVRILSPPDQSLWMRLLSGAAQKVGPQTFETWFRPLAFAGCDETTLRVTVPNQLFRKSFVENFSTTLEETIAETLRGPRQLVVATEDSPCESPAQAREALPVVQASDLEKSNSLARWLIEGLWTAQAVGVLAGQPKSSKTWLALEMAVSVATASPCLGTFPVHRSGPVLLYAAEESPPDLRFRLESLASVRGLDLERIDVRVITADSLRVDLPADQEKLHATVLQHRPVLLVLDPLIRVHRADENASAAMSAILAYFRSLQRQTGAAILLVHHVRKNPSTAGAGYSLRGSSDLYAWLDSFCLLHRRRDEIFLTAEHRSAPATGPFILKLITSAQHPHLETVTEPTLAQDPLLAQVLNLVATSPSPLSAQAIRSCLQVRKQRLLEALRCLSARGKIIRRDSGYALACITQQDRVPGSAP